MKKIVDKISDKTLDFITEYISKSVKEYKKMDLWEKAVRKACEATEGIDDSFADDILNLLLFFWLVIHYMLLYICFFSFHLLLLK